MKNDERMGLPAETMDRLGTRTAELTERTSQLMETMNRLGNTIISPEERLEDLEGHRPQ